MKSKISQNPLFVILFTVFVDLLGIGILIPVIPLLLADPRSPYYLLSSTQSPSYGFIILGLLTAIYPFMQFLAAPILGQLSDKYGRKKILIISLIGTSISYAVFAIAIVMRNIPLLFLSRAFDGVTGGNIAVAQAAIADITSRENRVKNFGYVGAAFGLGFIAGPFIGGKLSDPTLVSWFSASTPFWFAAILSFLNVISVILFFPETRKYVAKHFSIVWNKSIKNILAAFNFEGLKSLFITVFLFQSGFSFFVTFFGVFLIKRFNFNQGNIGNFFAYIGIWIIITQFFITGRVAAKFKAPQVLRITLMTTAIVILFYFIPRSWIGLLMISPFFAISNGLSQANLLGLISISADASIQGEVLGINASVQALAQSIPPIISGILAYEISPLAPIVVASAVVFISGIFFWTSFKPKSAFV